MFNQTLQRAPVRLNASPFGVHFGHSPFNLPTETQKKMTRSELKERWPLPWLMARMKEAGAAWCRANPIWPVIETKQGERDWWMMDYFVESADDAGIDLMLQIQDYPEMHLYGTNEAAKLKAYERFLRDVVRRYKSRVKHWQIENEVTSLNSGFGKTEEYIPVLQTAYRAIKAEDSSAKVILAGLGSNLVEPLVWESDSRDARKVYARIRDLIDKAKDYFDILDLHIYHNPQHVAAKIKLYQDLLQSLGLRKPIWISELGGPDPRYYEKRLKLKQSSTTPASEVIMRCASALTAGAERFFWHQFWLLEGERPQRTLNTALIRGKERTPFFSAYQITTRKLKGATTAQWSLLGTDMTACRFSKPSGDVYVLWSDTERNVNLRANQPEACVTDETAKTTKQNTSRVRVSQQPIFVEVSREVRR
jgi:hypothetical protein